MNDREHGRSALVERSRTKFLLIDRNLLTGARIERIVDINCAGGSIEAEMMVSDSNVDTHCTLISSGGDLILWIPKDLEATFDVELKITRWADEDYEIMSDFPLKIDKKGRGVVCGGDLNGGGDLIKLKTTNGDIEIRKLR